ncbi:hypothetical protein [Streptosporangium sp. NBC_01756]|nr:hypothetical protein [Streptosporangium sp. NBC_01756]WSC86747.1 hypothetical protein OIE48_00560 [Streptosporangium sp. NBC_01756]
MIPVSAVVAGVSSDGCARRRTGTECPVNVRFLTWIMKRPRPKLFLAGM